MDGRTGKEFMQKTQYPFLGQSDQETGVPQPPLELDCADEPQFKLPAAPALQGGLSLDEAIRQRRSVRAYSGQPLTQEELSYALASTQGIVRNTSSATLRPVPSAGARHAFETYLLVNHVEGLEPGIYRYLAGQHRLAQIKASSAIADELVAGCLGQPFVKTAAVTFFWVAVTERMTWRYGERGYRYLHLDAGHVCQNLYLVAENMDCGVCAIAAFLDEEVNSTLELDGEDQFVIYVATLGKKA